MTTREALSQLIHLNPNLAYSVSEDMRYYHGKLTKQKIECSWYYIHVHHDDDGAGMRKHDTFDGENLDNVLTQAIAFVNSIT